ncbi:MAG: hypothetical protein IK095_04400 [Oscillospiraceae bacterium]|nr:hypothetical protein [Oscillospiraceae bacterium]
MDETMMALAKAFRSFSCTADGGMLDMSSGWNGSTPGVEAVRVTLCGKDPLTGEEIPADLYRVEFSRTKRSEHSHPLPLFGNYELRFEAIGRNGVTLGSFREPYPIRVENRTYRPRLSYTLTREGKWLHLTIESNCPRRWNGRIWAEQGGHTVPLFWDAQQEAGNSFWFWRDRGDLLLSSDDQELPLKEKT